ncbi:Universal stress protein/MT2698 [Mycobacterium basiliense]|uniref:Universal stress protein/MT2698 n=1 Tax=Mycobacterium basiliense TaxID=2094119 RepID=A0A447GCZ2_9MYCO|nr:Universal stress protein/MT2698 [Mycobacterium basiliense]
MSSHNTPLGIIVGIDDSPSAKVAVRWARREAELRNVALAVRVCSEFGCHRTKPNETERNGSSIHRHRCPEPLIARGTAPSGRPTCPASSAWPARP